MKALCPARMDTAGYITDSLETALSRPASWPVSTPPCALTAHADIRRRCPLCPRIRRQGVAPGLCIFQLSRCRSRVLLRSYLAGFIAGVSCVTIADGVGLSPFNMTALTASRLSLVANQFRRARPPCPFHVTTHALRRRYRPVAQVSWACGIQGVQSHHRPGRMDSSALHTLGFRPSSLYSWSPNRAGPFP